MELVCDIQVAQMQLWVWFQTWRRRYQVSSWPACVTWASSVAVATRTLLMHSTGSILMTLTQLKFAASTPSNMLVI